MTVSRPDPETVIDRMVILLAELAPGGTHGKWFQTSSDGICAGPFPRKKNLQIGTTYALLNN